MFSVLGVHFLTIDSFSILLMHGLHSMDKCVTHSRYNILRVQIKCNSCQKMNETAILMPLRLHKGIWDKLLRKPVSNAELEGLV